MANFNQYKNSKDESVISQPLHILEIHQIHAHIHRAAAMGSVNEYETLVNQLIAVEVQWADKKFFEAMTAIDAHTKKLIRRAEMSHDDNKISQIKYNAAYKKFIECNLLLSRRKMTGFESQYTEMPPLPEDDNDGDQETSEVEDTDN